MFDDIEMGEFTEVTPTSDSAEQVVDTTNMVDGNVDNTQQVEQGNIQDATPEARTVPVDVVESMRKELQAEKAEKQKLLDLFIAGKQQAQPQQEEQKEEFNYHIDDDEYLDGKTFKQVLQAQKDYILNQIKQEQNKSAQSAREVQIIDYENQFRKTNSDYDEAIKIVPQNVLRSLYQTYSSPKDLVDNAYKIAKAMKGETPAVTPSVTPKVDVENKITQNLNKPKTLSQAKGTSTNPNDVSKMVEDLWAQL